MSGKRSRNKGKIGEREFAKQLTKHGYPAERGIQFAGGSESPDVRCKALPIHWEVKRQEAVNLKAALRQAEGDTSVHNAAVVATRANGEEWRVYLTFENFVWLMKTMESRGRVDMTATRGE